MSRCLPFFTDQHDGFFERTDWVSFWVAASITFAIYLVSVSTNTGLGLSGAFSVGAWYAGVPASPGYPMWTIYSWAFTHLLPVSNIAWRAAMASAVAGALTCGVVALMVSRGTLWVAGGLVSFRYLSARQQQWLRVVCGYVAGAGFGFSNAFWKKAIVADPWSLSVLCFAVLLCLLMCWWAAPGQRRYLFCAAFVYGLGLTNSQLLLAAGPGLVVLMLIRSCLVFRAWRTLLVCLAMIVAGLSPYFYTPVASMSNPPVNSGYTRVVEGFFYSIKRGQYETIHLTGDLWALIEQVRMYLRLLVSDFGWPYLIAALVPVAVVRWLRPDGRRWVLGLLLSYLVTTLLVLVVVNPAPDRQAVLITAHYFAISNLLLAVVAGYGLALGAIGITHLRTARPPEAPGDGNKPQYGSS